jgi:hypothetical protein
MAGRVLRFPVRSKPARSPIPIAFLTDRGCARGEPFLREHAQVALDVLAELIAVRWERAIEIVGGDEAKLRESLNRLCCHAGDGPMW